MDFDKEIQHTQSRIALLEEAIQKARRGHNRPQIVALKRSKADAEKRLALLLATKGH